MAEAAVEKRSKRTVLSIFPLVPSSTHISITPLSAVEVNKLVAARTRILSLGMDLMGADCVVLNVFVA